ncbi:MAG: class I SAM-dependent methyltransferase, partial [Caldilineaceae bacterium]
MRRCTNPACGTLWLDPRPLQDDLHLAYQTYYTHSGSAAKGGITGVGSADKLPAQLVVGALYAPVRLLFKQKVGRERAEAMYLHQRVPGRLLDVGCGDGTRLLRLRSLGWQVHGQDVDPTSVQVARTRGLTVVLGELVGADLDAGSFDAITMHHVLEHVLDPDALIRECHRLLAPGGVLVVTTPNARSLGLRNF